MLIVLAVVAAYSNSLHGPFVLDDLGVIPHNEAIRKLWPIWPVLTTPSEPGSTTQGRPFFTLSLAVSYRMGGAEDVVPYHAFNLAVHVLAALALYGIARRTLLSGGMPSPLARASTLLALATALLWAVHPLTTSAVTYIIQRAESLMGLLYLTTLYCAIRGAVSRRPAMWYVACFLACAAGMATKEVMVSAPLIVLLYDRAFLAGTFRGALRRRWGLYVALAATWGLLAILAASSGSRGGSAGFGQKIGVVEYALTQPWAILNYLRLALAPYPLCLDYGFPLAKTWMAILPGLAAVGLLLAASAWALVRRPRWGFLGAWFFLILAPTSSFVPIVTQTMAEHRMYLPLAAVMATATVGLPLAWRRVLGPSSRWRGRRGRLLGAGLIAAVAAAMGGLTVLRNEDYRDSAKLWRQTLTVAPDNPRAHRGLGEAYEAMGRIELALPEYERARQLDPYESQIFLVRGDYHRESGRRDWAIVCYTRAIEANPSLAVAYNNRGLCRMDDGQCEPALQDFNRALALQPGKAGGYLNRAICRYRMKDYAAARRDAEMCMELGGSVPAGFLQALAEAPP